MNCFFIILGQRHGVIILVKPINQELFEEWREIYLLRNIFVVCFEGLRHFIFAFVTVPRSIQPVGRADMF